MNPSAKMGNTAEQHRAAIGRFNCQSPMSTVNAKRTPNKGSDGEGTPQKKSQGALVFTLCFSLFLWSGRLLLERGVPLSNPPLHEALSTNPHQGQHSKGNDTCLLLFCCGDVEMNPGPTVNSTLLTRIFMKLNVLGLQLQRLG